MVQLLCNKSAPSTETILAIHGIISWQHTHELQCFLAWNQRFIIHIHCETVLFCNSSSMQLNLGTYRNEIREIEGLQLMFKPSIFCIWFNINKFSQNDGIKTANKYQTIFQ